MNSSFYSTNHAPYYIFGLDYIQQSAGIRALHYLCHALNELGQEAYITCEKTSPKLRTPILDAGVLKQHHLAGRRPIVVYPEIVPGDPLAAGGLVARWLLNTPGHIAGDASFPEDNLIFTYAKDFLPGGWNAELLHIPTCDLSIFNNDNNPLDKERDTICFYAHKYLFNGGTLTWHTQGATNLCKDQKLSHQEIADILRRSKLLYVYEPTAMIIESLLCGCPVAVIETEYWNTNVPDHTFRQDRVVFSASDPNLENNIHNANTRGFRLHYQNVTMKNAWIQTKRFIEITQNAAKARSLY